MRALRPLAALLAWGLLAAAKTIEPEADGCPEATVTAQIVSAQDAGGVLRVRGRIVAGGTATGALVEYRVDSDRYRSDVVPQREADLESSFPFKLCGDHVAQLWVYPLVAAGERQAVCLARSAQVKTGFNAACGAQVRFDGCDWECDGEACAGSCTVVMDGPPGTFELMASVAGKPFEQAAPPGPGPFDLRFACRSGDEIKLRVREAGARSYNASTRQVCGAP